MRLRWIFLAVAIGAFSLVFWGGDIAALRPKSTATAQIARGLAIKSLQDSLQKTLSVSQRRELDSLTSGVVDSLAFYARLYEFWHSKAGGAQMLLAHYYLGERGRVANNLGDLWQAGRFLLELLDITPKEGFKRYLAQLAADYLARARDLQAQSGLSSVQDSVEIALAVTELYGSQPMQGVATLKRYALADTAVFAVKFLAAAYFKIGKNLEALQLLQGASRKAPRDMLLQLRIAEAYERLNELAQAKQVYQRLWQEWQHELPKEVGKILQDKIRALAG